MNSETRSRSIAKTLTYRVVIAALLALIAFYFTGNPAQTTVITITFNLGGAAVYYGFERLWDAIDWGRRI
ncbi:MAG: DUF2061 domain-containing protein [Thaumarchaeota archaeon]|nr:DUF2061 domain-containing protein [Nitrososphaerota archaeon]